MRRPVFRVVVACTALAGCNQIFGLGETRPAVYDAPADAPFACPLDATPPRFSVLFRQVIPQGDCSAYTASRASANIAVMSCQRGTGDQATVVDEQAAVDDAMLNDMTFSPPIALGAPAISPEGDELWVGRTGAISVYRQDTPHSWVLDHDAYTASTLQGTPGTPMAHGTPRRVIMTGTLGIEELDEVAPGSFQPKFTYTVLTLQVGSVESAIQLSPDGHRMVFRGSAPDLTTFGVMYAWRDSLDVPFGAATLLTDVPADALTPFLAEDCSRLYFSGLASVLYLPAQ